MRDQGLPPEAPLRAKQAEVEAQIENLTARIAKTRSDLPRHDDAALRSQGRDKPATVYHSSTKASKRVEVFELSRDGTGCWSSRCVVTAPQRGEGSAGS